jgi:hypothetical protein
VDHVGLKKRRVKPVTRLPTKDMATACWELIVCKVTPLEPAPMLVFRSLREEDTIFYQQVINRL